jgi:hypothetical protein
MAGQRCDLTPEVYDPQSQWSSLSMLAQSSPVPENERMSSGVWRFNAGHSERECGSGWNDPATARPSYNPETTEH